MSPPFNRREALFATASALVIEWATDRGAASATTIKGALPWSPQSASPPQGSDAGRLAVFHARGSERVEAIVDRLIPADARRRAERIGCAVFIDRQLAGPYGDFGGLYTNGPFEEGAKQQGPQSPVTPRRALPQGAGRARPALPANVYGMSFAELSDGHKDEIIKESRE